MRFRVHRLIGRMILENPRYTGYAVFERWTKREILGRVVCSEEWPAHWLKMRFQ
jgi:hypothetical protein